MRLERHRVLREVLHPLDELLREDLSAPGEIKGFLQGLEELHLGVRTSHVYRNVCRAAVSICAESEIGLHTVVLEDGSNSRLDQPDGRSEHLQIMVERQCVPELALAKVVVEVVEIRLGQVVELGLHLDRIANALELTEFLASEKVDVHVDTLLHRRDLSINAPDVEERLDVAFAQNGGETLACC